MRRKVEATDVTPPAVDFRELPAQSRDGHLSDAFELFAREFFEALGFRVTEHPARGTDLGRDLVLDDVLVGKFATESMRWIVSVKHNAHSGRSVQPRDEPDPKGAVDAAQAHGFVGFYSTLPSTHLRNRLAGLRGVKVKIYDHAAIERELLRPDMEDLFRRFFPKSWMRRRDAEDAPLVVSADHDPVRPEEEVAIDLSPLLRSGSGVIRFSDPDLERIMTAALLASDIREDRLERFERFVSFNADLWKYLIVLLREKPPDSARLAKMILRMKNPFVLRNLTSLAGRLSLSGCAAAICAQTMNCSHYDKQLTDRGYDFGLMDFSDTAKRALSSFDAAVLPILDEHREQAKAQRRWKAKSVFEAARAAILRRATSST